MDKYVIFYSKVPGDRMYKVRVQNTCTYEYLHDNVDVFPEFLEDVLKIIEEKYPNSYRCEVKY